MESRIGTMRCSGSRRGESAGTGNCQRGLGFIEAAALLALRFVSISKCPGDTGVETAEVRNIDSSFLSVWLRTAKAALRSSAQPAHASCKMSYTQSTFV
jgi:hypothetical protein